MDRFRFFGKTYKDTDGVTKIKYKATGKITEKIYYDLKAFSSACEYASSQNLHEDILKVSNSLATIALYQDYYYERLLSEGEEDFIIAKLFIVCRFSNSIYAAIRLACMGLILDSIGCLKTAFEALQYSRLISLDVAEAPTFLDPEHSLRPVEVRKRLEKLGHDVERARERYGILSTYSHIGGQGETLTLEEIDENISFRIGGFIDVGLQRGILEDCHKAMGEFVAFNAGVRQENVEEYHQTIKDWNAEGISREEILKRIPDLIKKHS